MYQSYTKRERQTRKYLAQGWCARTGPAMSESKYFPIQPDLTQTRTIIYISHKATCMFDSNENFKKFLMNTPQLLNCAHTK